MLRSALMGSGPMRRAIIRSAMRLSAAAWVAAVLTLLARHHMGALYTSVDHVHVAGLLVGAGLALLALARHGAARRAPWLSPRRPSQQIALEE